MNFSTLGAKLLEVQKESPHTSQNTIHLDSKKELICDINERRTVVYDDFSGT